MCGVFIALLVVWQVQVHETILDTGTFCTVVFISLIPAAVAVVNDSLIFSKSVNFHLRGSVLSITTAAESANGAIEKQKKLRCRCNN